MTDTLTTATCEADEAALAHADTAGLRYSCDATPGIRRVDAPPGFEYRTPDGRRVTDSDTLARIRDLAIPPAWTDVWICEDARGHLQATGRDARGRKQYRYHPDWRRVRDEAKFDRVLAFGEALPVIRARVDSDLRRHRASRERAVATVVRLLDDTFARVGNVEYRDSNDSYGLTTLRDDNVEDSGGRVRLRFRGKAGRDQEVEVCDPRVARAIRRMRDLPGEELFQWIDDEGIGHPIDSAAVNDYLRDAAGEAFSSKDFRTWGGTLTAAVALARSNDAETEPERRRRIVSAIEVAAERLGNTPAVCRRSYVDPVVIEAYLSGRLQETWRRTLGDAPRPDRTQQEAFLLALLEDARAGAGLA